jgi:catechol 2,3-dioxygenase-like lactoylglutathione lyase family enzyme
VGVHHIGIAVADLAESLRFYRDGLGCEVFLEETFDRDWKRLVDTPASRMRAVIVAHPENPACAIELIAFEDGVQRQAVSGPPTGVFLVAFETHDVEATKARLVELGYGNFEHDHSVISGQRIDVTFARDPDGVVVELVASAEARAAGL